MKKLALVIALIGISTTAWANPPGSGESNGNGCVENCGHQGGAGGNGGSGGSGGNGGNGGTGGTGIGTGIGTASSASGALATGGSAGSSSSSLASSAATSGSNTNDIRSFALSGGSVGSPSDGTCAAHTSIFFGLATFPVTISTCLAERQALLLWSFGQKDAALERLCAIPEVAATSACPKPAAKVE